MAQSLGDLVGFWEDPDNSVYEVTLDSSGCTVKTKRANGIIKGPTRGLIKEVSLRDESGRFQRTICFGLKSNYKLDQTLSAPSMVTWTATGNEKTKSFVWYRPSQEAASRLSCADSFEILGGGRGESSSSWQPIPASVHYTEANPSTTARAEAEWEFALNANVWKPYGRQNSMLLEDAWQQYRELPNPQDGGSKLPIERNGNLYEIDFANMVQINLNTGRQCAVRRCELNVTIPRSLQNTVEQPRQESHLEMEKQMKQLERHLAEKEERIRQLEQDGWSQSVSFMREKELWRKSNMDTWDRAPPEKFSRPLLVPLIQDLLRSLIPTSHGGTECSNAKSIVVQEVFSLVNREVWKSYVSQKEKIAKKIYRHQDCPWVHDEFPEFRKIKERMSDVIDIDAATNEVLLFHGTKASKVEDIMKEGFDHRLSSGRNLYGLGLYFTPDACKVLQYCKDGDGNGRHCIIMARCTLGNPYFAQGPMKTHKRPPRSKHDVPHDSIIARRGIPNETKHGRQLHVEVVTPDGSQTYPELLIHY